MLKKNPSTLNARDRKIYNVAKSKEIKNQKYSGDRNFSKRENTKRKAPKGAKTLKPPRRGWSGGSCRS